MKCKDGSYKWIEGKAKTTGGKNGEKRLIVISRDINERKKAEQELKRNIEIEQCLWKISNRFLGDIDIDKAINVSLEEIGKLRDADQVFLFRIYNKKDVIGITHGWSTENISPKIEELHNLPIEPYNWAMSKLRAGKIIHITDISSLPEAARAEKEVLEEQNIKSLLAVPIYFKGKLSGVFGFNNVSEKSLWEEQDIILSKLTATMLGKAIRQKQREKKLHNTLNQLKKTKEKYLEITNLTGDIITKADSDGKWTFVNDTACEFYGKSREKLLDSEFEDYLHPDDVQKTHDAIRELIKGGKVVKGFINRQKTPRGWRIVEWNVLPNFDGDGNYSGFQSTGRDITKRKEAEQEIKEALRKSKFYKDLLSHDMANILTNIKSSIRLMEMWKNDPTKSEDRRKMLDLLTQQVERGGSLISNVRKLTKLENVDQKIFSVDVIKILKNAIEHIHSRTLEKDIDIHADLLDKNIKVKGGDLLLDVFENLLINCCIHNESKHIQIWIKSSRVQRNEQNYVKIEFKDNGVGIRNERKKNIFERDYERKGNKGGMGIGLSLVKEIIEGYEGEIWIENRVEEDYSQGSNFIVLLPEDK